MYSMMHRNILHIRQENTNTSKLYLFSSEIIQRQTNLPVLSTGRTYSGSM